MNKLWEYLVAAFLAVVAFFKGQHEQQKKGERALDKEVENAKDTRKDVADDVRNDGPDERDARRSEWFRD